MQAFSKAILSRDDEFDERVDGDDGEGVRLTFFDLVDPERSMHARFSERHTTVQNYTGAAVG